MRLSDDLLEIGKLRGRGAGGTKILIETGGITVQKNKMSNEDKQLFY